MRYILYDYHDYRVVVFSEASAKSEEKAKKPVEQQTSPLSPPKSESVQTSPASSGPVGEELYLIYF